MYFFGYNRLTLAVAMIMISGCNALIDDDFGEDEPTSVPSSTPAVKQRAKLLKDSKSIFTPAVRGLRLTRSIVVRAGPSRSAEKLGTVAAHTIVGWDGVYDASEDEKRWIAIKPAGWVMEKYVEPVTKAPIGVELPKLGIAEYVPGVYGKIFDENAVVATVNSGAIVAKEPILIGSTVRKRNVVTIGGVPYWKIDGDRYIAESSLRLHTPSGFQGRRLQGSSNVKLPVAFVLSGQRSGDWVVVRNVRSGKVRRIAPRTLISVNKQTNNVDGKTSLLFINEDEFLAADDVRLVKIYNPPATIGEHERWIDVDLDSQILVAYEGRLPVYTTLVSSGTQKNPTKTGIFRIWIKFSETTMSGRMGEQDAYSVAMVPWTQFYDKDFALHASYWHDRFGEPRSHGCINLSPRDARFLYFWSDPQVPKGWSMANHSSLTPGSLVRIHSRADPEPEPVDKSVNRGRRRKIHKRGSEYRDEKAS